MRFYKVKPEALAILTPEDRNALQGIYKHRCLTEEQLATYFYNKLDDGKNNYTLSRIRALVAAGFVEPYEYGEDQQCVLYLTHMGVQYNRDQSETGLVKITERGVQKNEITYSSLKMKENNLNHQTELNSLSLEIERRCGLSPDCYKDSLFTKNFNCAHPDGVFEFPEFDIFLEMDMGHERKGALCKKWSHYQAYLSSRDYYIHRDKKLIVLFAAQNVSSMERRRVTVVETISQMLMGYVGENLNFYIGSSEEMAAVAERLILKERGLFEQTAVYLKNELGFSFSRPRQIEEACREPFLYMAVPGPDGRPEVRGGRPLEFLFENYSNRQLLALKRAAAFENTQVLLESKLGREIPLLVLAPSENEIYRDLATIGALSIRNVYYTTPARLKTKPFYEALVQFDDLDRRFHFADWALSERIYDKREKSN